MRKVLIYGKIAGKGGIQRIVYWLAKILVEENCHVLVISPGSVKISGVNQLSPEIRFDCVFGDSLLTEVSNYLPKNIQKFSKIAKLARDFDPDIYIGIGSSWNLSLIPLLLRKSVRNIFFEVTTGIPSGWKDSRWGVKFWFNEVVGISPTIAETFAKAFQYKKLISAISGFAEPLEITASLPPISQRKVELGKAKAAYFGRIVPHKQAFWLVKQWDLLNKYLGELHIHGVGPDEEAIKEYIAFHDLSERVKCFGSYPSEGQAYGDLLSSYDLTLLPTLGNEGAPLVLMESMACGVPFVAYGVNGIPDYGVDNTNVIIVPPEPWVTNQAKEFTTTGKPSQTKAFIDAVGEMSHKLAEGKINQMQLQQFYLERYSYQVLKNAWLSYLCK